MRKIIITAFIFSLLNFSMLEAQINAPASSPVCTLSQKIGLTTIKVVYSRPGVKDRTIFGGLVPYGELWRTGANASTKITFSDNVQIDGKTLPKGTYALYSVPGEKEWEIVIHSNTEHWGIGGKKYKESEDVMRVKVKPSKTAVFVESFTIQIGNLSNNGGEIIVMWENTAVRLPFIVDTDSKVMADIKQKLAGPSSSTYYEAARYYYEAEKDLKQALEWIKAAQKDEEKFWMMRLQALIEAKMENYKSAIKSATKSKELAQKSDNKDYVRLNEKSIEEWKALK